MTEIYQDVVSNLILEQLPYFIFWKNAELNYLGCNKNFSDLVKLNHPLEVVGKSDYDLPWGKDEADFFRKIDQEVMNSQQVSNTEEILRQADGLHKVMLVSKVPIKNSAGSVIGVLGMSTEITQQKKTEQELREAKDTVFKLAAQVAHDIRSPLVALNIFLQDIDALPEKQRNLMRSATQRINDIANNLLHHYVQQTHSKEAPLAEPIITLVDSVLSEKRVQFIQRNIQFKENIASNMYDAFVKVDPVAFKRALSNLLNNAAEAIRDSGIVEVSIEQKQQQLILSIRDTGCGISIDKLSLITQSGVTFGKQGGSGLGLTYAVEKIKEWQGNYTIKSTLGIGTTVTLTLPLAEPAAWFARPIYFTAHSILVVLDDDPSIHEVWQSRYKELVLHYPTLKIINFYQPADLIEFKHANKDKSCLYFIDYELIGKTQTGIELVKTLDIAKQSYLVTSRYEDKKIRQQCIDIGLTIIPKPYSAYIPFNLIK